jgi:hypothetical protein
VKVTTLLKASAGLALGLALAFSATPASAAPSASGSAPAVEAAAVTPQAQEIFLGDEFDKCSGSLSVKDRDGHYVPIPRGQWTRVEVAIDGSGYWRWKCGSSGERSRGELDFRQRVKVLYVWHSTNNRNITWHCYDLLP